MSATAALIQERIGQGDVEGAESTTDLWGAPVVINPASPHAGIYHVTRYLSRGEGPWCAPCFDRTALEFVCWKGKIIRVAFALDCHDREVISWVVTTAGISGEMIREMMVRSVEQRFGMLRSPHPV
jgi:hypothetical protein